MLFDDFMRKWCLTRWLTRWFADIENECSCNTSHTYTLTKKWYVVCGKASAWCSLTWPWVSTSAHKHTTLCASHVGLYSHTRGQKWNNPCNPFAFILTATSSLIMIDNFWCAWAESSRPPTRKIQIHKVTLKQLLLLLYFNCW